MENAILTSGLSRIPDKGLRENRIYFGSEFCDFLLPRPGDIDRLLDIKKIRNVDFSIVTPYFNERSLSRLKELLAYLYKKSPANEVVINDWGAFDLITERFPGFQVILGRILSKQKRGFFVSRSSGKKQLIRDLLLKKNDVTHLRSSILQNDYLMRFIAERGIKRIALDNCLQGIDYPGKNSVNIDLYYPYVYVTTSNYCLTQAHSKNFIAKNMSCDKACLKGDAPAMEICGQKMYLKGNTQFYYNDDLAFVKKGAGNRLIKVIL